MTDQFRRMLSGHRSAFTATAIFTAAGLALRLIFALAYWVDKPLTHDELEYLALARSLAAGQGFRYPRAASEEIELERFGRAPIYPFVLSGIGGPAALDSSPTAVPRRVKIVQSFVGAVGIPILAAVAWRAAGPEAGVVAALVAAVYPPLVWISAYALTEVWYFVLAWLSALLLGLAIDRRPPVTSERTTALAVAAGAIGGVAALTRPAMVVFLGLATLWLGLRCSRRLAAAFVVAAALVVGPWTARNLVEYRRVVPIASEGGITFWVGNHPLARGEGDMAANPEIKLANLEFRRRHPGMSPEELEPIYYREAFTYIIEHPVWWIGLLLRKAFYLVVPIGPSYTLHSVRYQLASIVPYVAILPFAVGGARALIRSRAPARAVPLLFLSAVLTCLLFFPQERFRIPVIDPTLIVWAAVWIARRPRGEETGRLA